jgi:hypothetical protein
VKAAGKALGFGKEKDKEKGGQDANKEAIGKEVPFSAESKDHKLYIKQTGTKYSIIVESSPAEVRTKLNAWKAEINTDAWKDGRKATKKARIAEHIEAAEIKVKELEGNIATVTTTTTTTDEAKKSQVIAKENSLVDILKVLFADFDTEAVDYKILFAENLVLAHDMAKDGVVKAVDQATEENEKKGGRLKAIQAWSGLQEEIKNKEDVKSMMAKPLGNSLTYGSYTRKQLETAGKKVLADKYSDEKKDKVQNYVDETEGSVANRKLREQIL